uniref:Uncharacterized protein n=1 Tax=Onchocerca volvulus TaxID=6282 RepID=A0A8R1TWA1_ONCVO
MTSMNHRGGKQLPSMRKFSSAVEDTGQNSRRKRLQLEVKWMSTNLSPTSHYFRELFIDCSVPLPSTQVNALFDICFPNVIHLNIGSFKDID